MLSQIEKVNPSEIFISIDGARGELDINTIEEVKSIISDFEVRNTNIKVNKKYQDKNLGCGKNVSSSIDWFFENVPQGIILEDDCVPNESFFKYCEELLNKYKDVPEIMHISGTNITDYKRSDGASYTFSDLCIIWGWATWKRAWDKYDFEMKGLDEFIKNKYLLDIFPNDEKAMNFYNNFFVHIKENNVNTWDAQWQYTLFKERGLSTIPCNNMISNAGFREDATFTKEHSDIFANKTLIDIDDIKHPSDIKPDKEYEDKWFRLIMGDWQPMGNQNN